MLKISQNFNFAVWDVLNREQGVKERGKTTINKVVKIGNDDEIVQNRKEISNQLSNIFNLFLQTILIMSVLVIFQQ